MLIEDVLLPARDPVAQTAFYEGVLGARGIRFSADPGPICLHLAFNVSDDLLDGAEAWLSERGLEMIARMPFPNWDADAVYFLDREGNVLELIARHRLGLRGDGLSVSEVGIPVASVPAAIERVGAPEFWREGDRFAAVGDDHGLLILAPPGRAWWPTEHVARGAPLAVCGTIPPPMRLFALRGATSVPSNDRDAILAATEELVKQILERNALDPARIVSCIFTATDDLDAEFPAVAARSLGLDLVPLLCAREIDVPGSMPRVIRALVHYHGDEDHEPTHVYLGEARQLRADLHSAQ